MRKRKKEKRRRVLKRRERRREREIKMGVHDKKDNETSAHVFCFVFFSFGSFNISCHVFTLFFTPCLPSS